MKTATCLHCKQTFKKVYKMKRFCSLLCSNRYNLNNFNQVHLPKKSKKLAEFIGIMIGDGHSTKYFSAITLNSIADRDYIPYVANLAKELFKGAPVTIIPNKRHNYTTVQISSKMVSSFLQEMGIISYKKIIPNWILINKTYSHVCLRGLVDTEGSISYKVYRSRKGLKIYKQLNFRNADLNLIIFAKETLEELNLKPTASLKRSLYLSNHSAIEKYREVIGFSNPKLLNRSLVIDNPSYQKWRGTEVAITGRS